MFQIDMDLDGSVQSVAESDAVLVSISRVFDTKIKWSMWIYYIQGTIDY